jgi:hypothetical protein
MIVERIREKTYQVTVDNKHIFVVKAKNKEYAVKKIKKNQWLEKIK